MDKNKLYVGNLSWSLTEDELKDFLKTDGEVLSVKIIEGKGFGFVEVGSKEDAERIKANLNGKELKGRALRIDDARPQKPRNNRY